MRRPAVLRAFLRGVVRWPFWGAGDLGQLALSCDMKARVVQRSSPNMRTEPHQRALHLFSMNIAYGRGPTDDAGNLKDRREILQHLDSIAEMIRSSNADIALLQEVDLASARTHFIHQGHALLERLDWPFYAEVPVWRATYVPHPPHRIQHHYKRVHTGQVVLSRHPIERNTRVALPGPDAWTRIYKSFYLQRAAQVVRIRLSGRPVDLANIHLEAYNQTNREHQATLIARWMRHNTTPHRILAGDFNTLPPKAFHRSGFWDEPDIDFAHDRTLPLLHQTLPGLCDVLGECDNEHTWTFPAHRPTRRLDFVFAQHDAWRVRSASVLGDPQHPNSDHRPILTTLTLRDEPEQPQDNA